MTDPEFTHMQSIILYSFTGQLESNSPAYTQLKTRVGIIMIRAEVFGGHVEGALNAAKPRLGEIVLNTIPAPKANNDAPAPIPVQ